ncbi:MAG: hypothetical protein GY797_21100 [Deltaproteobacteria bacterium]|nr:hypothetical protein [Deltaproteobacteria bacterium]
MKPCSGGFIPGVWRGEGGGGTPPTPPAPSATPFKMTDRRVNFVIVLIEIGLWLFMWGIFAITLEGNWEHIMMHGLLPALMLLLYAIDWRALWRTAGAVEQRSQFYPGQVS